MRRSTSARRGISRRGEVVDLLFRLVDRSLVVPDPDTGRFRLLVTIRDYGWTKLREAGEADAVQARHLEYFTAFADEHGSLTRSGGRDPSGCARSTTTCAPRSTTRSTGPGARGRPDDVDAGFRLADAMRWFWRWEPAVRGRGRADRPPCAARRVAGVPGPRAAGLRVVPRPLPHPRVPGRGAGEPGAAGADRRHPGRSNVATRDRLEGQFGGDFQASWAMVRQAEEDLDQDADPGVPLMLHYIKALLHLGQGAFDASIAGMGARARTGPRNPAPGPAGGDVLAPRHRPSGDGTRARGGRYPAPGRGSRRARWLPASASPSRSSTSATPCSAAAIRPRRESCSTAATTCARRVQNPRCQAWAAWGRARLAFTDGRADLAVEECRRATALLQDREFPWALVQLWEFHAETATAAGRLDVADEARAAARQVTITNS